MNEIDKLKFSTKIFQLASETVKETKLITEKEFDSILDSSTLTRKEKYDKMRTHLDISALSYCSTLIDKVFQAYFDFLESSEINLSNSDINLSNPNK